MKWEPLRDWLRGWSREKLELLQDSAIPWDETDPDKVELSALEWLIGPAVKRCASPSENSYFASSLGVPVIVHMIRASRRVNFEVIDRVSVSIVHEVMATHPTSGTAIDANGHRRSNYEGDDLEERKDCEESNGQADHKTQKKRRARCGSVHFSRVL